MAIIHLADGSRLRWRTLAAKLPNDYFFGADHVRVASQLAEGMNPPGSVLPTLVNLLARRSPWTRQLTALRWALDSGWDIRHIAGPWPADELECLLGRSLPSRISLGYASPDGSVVPWRLTVRLGIKALWHGTFRLRGFRGGTLPSSSAIRAMTEVSVRVFPKEAESATVLVYPAPYSRQRQRTFFTQHRPGAGGRGLAGLPFRAWDVVAAMLARPSQRAVAVACAEHQANTRHGVELARAGVCTLYTTDEFEIGSFALHQAFRAEGGRSVNAAHGVGLYCPIVGYNEFRVLTAGQADYYRANNPELVLSRQEALNARVELQPGRRYRPKVVIVHQEASYTAYAYESRAQREMLRLVQAIAKDAGWPVAIKAHPAHGDRAVRHLAQVTGVQVFREWSTVAHDHPIVFLLNSTVFFEVLGVAPVFVYHDGVLQPERYLGHGLPRVEPGSDWVSLSHLGTAKEWLEMARNQAAEWQAANHTSVLCHD